MMKNSDVRALATMAICVCALCACSGDDDDGGAGSSGNAGSGGRAGNSGNAGSSGGGAGSSGGAGTSGASGRGGSGGNGGSSGSGNAGNGAGNGGSGGDTEDDAGMEPAAGEGGEGGASGNGGNDPTAVATIAGFNGGSVTGTWTFTQEGANVTVVIELENCPDGTHQVHIHEGTGCASEQDQGMHWGPTRGEGIPNVECSGGEGTVTHTRSNVPTQTAWSIGGNPQSDIVGHAVVVHEAGGTGRIGCGVIEEQ